MRNPNLTDTDACFSQGAPTHGPMVHTHYGIALDYLMLEHDPFGGDTYPNTGAAVVCTSALQTLRESAEMVSFLYWDEVLPRWKRALASLSL